MATLRTKCPYCEAGIGFSDNLMNQVRPCPKCKRPVRLVDRNAGDPRAEALESLAAASAGEVPLNKPPAQPAAPPPPPPPGPTLPERMKANRVLAGRTCPGCSGTIELGDEVFNCPRCHETMHLACREARGSCASVYCAPLAAPAAGPAAQAVDAAGLLPCRFCRELIQPGARKCRFCGEYQSEAERSLVKLKAEAASGDTRLSLWEILLGVFCSGIACIVAIVYLVQGKKKGWKLILISLAMQALWTIVSLAIRSAGRHP